MAVLLLSLPAYAQVTVEWDKTAGGNGWEELNTLITTSDGGYLAGGLTTSVGPAPGTEVTHTSRDTAVFPELTGDVWLVKLDSLGQVQWDGRYGGYKQDRLWSAHETVDGGFILGGESLSGNDPGTEHQQFNRGDFDYWLLKIDRNGNFERDWTFGGPGKDVLRVVIPVDDGYMLFGYSDSDNNINTWGEKTGDSRGEEDFWIVKTDFNLNYQEDWTIGGSGRDILNDAKMLPDGNFILSGWSTSPESIAGELGEKTTPNYGLNDFWILKIDPQANILWEMNIGGDRQDVPNDLIITPEGDIVVVGFSDSQAASENGIGNKTEPWYGSEDVFIVKIIDNGTSAQVEWQKTYGGNAADLGYSAVRTGLGNFMVVSHSASPDTSSGAGNKYAPIIGGKDVWVLYLDPDGNKLWDAAVGGLGDDTSNKIVKAHDDGFVFGGNSSSNQFEPFKSEDSRGGWNDMWIVKTGCSIQAPGLEDFTSFCNDGAVVIDATVDSCFQCSYLWSDGESNPVREFLPNESVDLKLVIQHPDGCEAIDSIKIDVVPGIETAISSFSPITCFGTNDAEFFIEEVVGGSPPYLYRLNDGDTLDVAFFTGMSPGTYTLEIIDTNGCTYDTAFYIEQPQEVLVELGPDREITFGDSLQLQALTNLLPGTFSFEWNLPELLSCTDCLLPWVQPLSSTTFSIVLQDSMGCEARDQMQVILEQGSSVFIPNIFSPNNDNVNDFFTVYADASVRQILRFQIYNRWGELLFSKVNLPPNQDQLGWDGYRKGRAEQPGVYLYVLELEYVDDRREIRTGSVTLTR